MNKKPVAIILSVAVLIAANALRAETTDCSVINSLPEVVTNPGIYCLTNDLATAIDAGYAIEIAADDVVIDFNNHALHGLAGPGTHATGVYAQDRRNITLRNANIQGFFRGVRFFDSSPDDSDSGAHVIEDSRFDGNTNVGILVEGAGISIRRNQIRNTGGSTVSGAALGISSRGPGVEIMDNTLFNIFGSGSVGSAFGISLSLNTQSAMVLRNRVMQTVSSGPGKSYGIYHSHGVGVLIQDNQLVNANPFGSTAIRGAKSLWCLAIGNSTKGYFGGVDSVNFKCTDGGGNVSVQ